MTKFTEWCDEIETSVSSHRLHQLTTHDAQQARFLMRKLSNDGVDARLWTFEPSLNGMTAKQIGGRE